MKKLVLFFAIAAIAFSCSDDFVLSGSGTNQEQDIYFSRPGDTLPQNSDNDYDIAGKIHNDLLNAYYGGTSFPATTSGIASLIDSLANLNADFALIKGGSYVPVPVARIEYLLSNRDSCVVKVLNSSSLSLHAQSSLKTFMENLQIAIDDEDDYGTIHSFITSFEADVLTDNLMTSKDKEVILTTTSIARFSVYMKKKRPKKNTDPDWAWLTANIMAGTDGADTGMAEAISRGVVAGIVDNR